MKSFTTRTEIITPEKAAKYLELNTLNRNISQSRVNALAEDMRHGHFIVTPHGISFDTTGKLLDGQHRLTAIVASGKTVYMTVHRNVPVSQMADGRELFTMDVIDRCRPRTTPDQLQLLHGVTNANLITATARMLACACIGDSKTLALSVPQARPIIAVYAERLDEMVHLATTKVARVAGVIAALVLGAEVNRNLAQIFMRNLASGEGLTKGQPVFHLRERLKDHPCAGFSARYQAMLSVAQAFYNTLRGKRITTCKASQEGLEFLLGKQQAKVRVVCDAIGRKPKTLNAAIQ